MKNQYALGSDCVVVPGDVLSYLEMCQLEKVNLQRGMNFRLRGGLSVILMSVRRGAPYQDRVDEEGRTLIYEGHDIPNRSSGPDPKKVDQPMRNPNGSLTQNGLFFEAARRARTGVSVPECVKVYEKIRAGIWVYNGIFQLVDAWTEYDGTRYTFKYRLELFDDGMPSSGRRTDVLGHNRLIPTSVKLRVWQRDQGTCVMCGSSDNLHFDHVIPYSKGGSSLVPENIQLLCARHNLEKHDRIE